MGPRFHLPPAPFEQGGERKVVPIIVARIPDKQAILSAKSEQPAARIVIRRKIYFDVAIVRKGNVREPRIVRSFGPFDGDRDEPFYPLERNRDHDS